MSTKKWRSYDVDPQPIGFGSHSKVYKGYDPIYHREVVIKRTTEIERANFEAMIMKRYGDHPYLVQYYDFFRDEHHAFIVMEKVRGDRLGEIREGTKREEEKAIQITINLLQGISHLNSIGFFHTDIGPQNILINNDDPDSVKLLDFGAAVQAGSDGIFKGVRKGGTVGFRPADEPKKKEIILDYSTDVYAAACICVYLLTGKAPFKPREALNELRNNRLKGILMKAMHVEREKRYHSAQELIKDLENYR